MERMKEPTNKGQRSFNFKEVNAEVKGGTIIHGWVTRVEDLNSLDIERGFRLFFVMGDIVQTVTS